MSGRQKPQLNNQQARKLPNRPRKGSQPQQGKYCTYHLEIEPFSGALLLMCSEAYISIASIKSEIILQCNKQRVKIDPCAQQ